MNTMNKPWCWLSTVSMTLLAACGGSNAPPPTAALPATPQLAQVAPPQHAFVVPPLPRELQNDGPLMPLPPRPSLAELAKQASLASHH